MPVVPMTAEQQINQSPGQDNLQADADIATLTDGRFFVVFEDLFASGNIDIGGQFVLANGTLTGTTLVNGASPTGIEVDAGDQTNPAVAWRTGGAAVVVWEDAGDIELAIIDASGTNTTAGTELNVITGTTGAADTQSNADVATLSDGRSLIVWESLLGGTDRNIEARILNTAGTGFTTVDRLSITTNVSHQQNAAIAAQGLLALTVYEDESLGGAGSTDIVGRLFNGSSDTFGTEFTIANVAGDLQKPEVAALADSRFAVVYTDGTDIFAKIYDPSTPGGAFLSTVIQVDAVGGSAQAPRVTATIDGGFLVSWEQLNGGNLYDVFERRYDAHGQPLTSAFQANTLVHGLQVNSAIASSGDRILTVWDDDGTTGRADPDGGLRGYGAAVTASDYNSSPFGDLTGDGRSEILFQNESTGTITQWRLNASGVLIGITPLFTTGMHVEGTGVFNTLKGDDVLLRSGGQIGVLILNGPLAPNTAGIGAATPEWAISGIGDFTGDGFSDLLFRHVGTGEIATWKVVNNQLAAPPAVLGSAPAAYHIVAVNDFSGDHQADILFRHDSGAIALWQVANNALAATPFVMGGTSSSYHVVGTGDFDGSGSSDILFRNDDGTVAVWLLTASGQLLSATAIGTAGLEYHVDGTGDFNSDGRTDILLRHADGSFVEWLMNGTSFTAAPSALNKAAVDEIVATHHFDLI